VDDGSSADVVALYRLVGRHVVGASGVS